MLGDVRTTFIKPEGVVDAVIAKFKDDDRVVREAAIKAVVLLAKHGKYVYIFLYNHSSTF